MYVSVRNPLTPGAYACSFEYRFATVPDGKADFQFSCVTDRGIYVNLTPRTEWTAMTFRVILTKEMEVKTGFGLNFAQPNTLELRGFRLERLSDDDFAKLEYPSNRDCWINRSTDRRKSSLSEIDASDHVLGGKAVQVSASPDFPADGLLNLSSVSMPLPQGRKYRFSYWIKGDGEGAVRAAVGGRYFTERMGTEWKKVAVEFESVKDKNPLTGISFQTLDRGIRVLAVKNVELEMVK